MYLLLQLQLLSPGSPVEREGGRGEGEGGSEGVSEGGREGGCYLLCISLLILCKLLFIQSLQLRQCHQHLREREREMMCMMLARCLPRDDSHHSH